MFVLGVRQSLGWWTAVAGVWSYGDSSAGPFDLESSVWFGLGSATWWLAGRLPELKVNAEPAAAGAR